MAGERRDPRHVPARVGPDLKAMLETIWGQSHVVSPLWVAAWKVYRKGKLVECVNVSDEVKTPKVFEA